MTKLLTTAVSCSLASVGAMAAEWRVHSFHRQLRTTEYWSEGATAGDFNRDGKADVVSGPYRYAGPDFRQRHEIYPAARTHTNQVKGGAAEVKPGWIPKVYSDNFLAFVHDFNRDSWPDILVVGFPGEAAAWYENPQGASARGGGISRWTSWTTSPRIGAI